MSRVLIRETLVLCLGAVVAVVTAMAFGRGGDGLQLVHGIVMPIVFCLGRAAFASSPPRNAAVIRRFLHQVFMAIALIMLLLFEMGLGLFVGANDIPVMAWTVVGSFAIVYVAFISITESVRMPVASDEADWQ